VEGRIRRISRTVLNVAQSYRGSVRLKASSNRAQLYAFDKLGIEDNPENTFDYRTLLGLHHLVCNTLCRYLRKAVHGIHPS